MALLVLWCIAAGALAPASHVDTSDRRDGKHVAGLACQRQVVEMRGSRRDRDAGSQRIDSAIWLHPASGRLLGCTNAAQPAQQLLSVTMLPFYHLATHLSV
jgi:hypothetical protein